MARIIKKGEGLENQLKGQLNGRKRSFMAALILAVIGGILLFSAESCDVRPLLVVALLFCGGAVVSLMVGLFAYSDDIDALAAGVMGENAAVRCVSMLPDSYTAFCNLSITYEGKRSELDIVIVGPTGVFVVEIKNKNGTIKGDATEHNWTQHKVGRGGTAYASGFYNPIKQVNTHVFRLARYLKSNGIYTYVKSAVYFSNAETVVHITDNDEKTPVFSARDNGANSLLGYVMNNKQRVAREECDKIIAVLKRA